MIFLKLFIVFSKIGIFNFGGGYAMLSLIQNDGYQPDHTWTYRHQLCYLYGLYLRH